MGDKTIVFMRNHGPLAVGETVAHAFDRLYYLEEACKHQVLAMQTGRRMKPIERPIAEKVGRFVADVPEFSERHLNAIKRVLDREEPDYKN
jgi:ribulose-5-phosphate 4-epimerase/fuculose-1-phosphate aldolase